MAVPFFPEPPEELAADYQAIKRLEQQESAGNWQDAILSCARILERETNSRSFTVAEFYARFTAELAAQFPQNHNVEAKIRQQLRALRDRNILSSEAPGRFRIIG